VDVAIVDGTALPWMPHRTYAGVYARSVINSGISADLEVKVIRITPGAQVPPHTHGRSAETFYVLSGEGAFNVGGDWVPCHEGCCAHAKPGTEHGAKNSGEADLLVLAIFTPPLSEE
jgi:mannose-6-phosphate isomerase-like protein (cupin superfamily)